MQENVLLLVEIYPHRLWYSSRHRHVHSTIFRVAEDDLRLGNKQRSVDPSDNLAAEGRSLIGSSAETRQIENSKLHEEIDQSRRMSEEMLKDIYPSSYCITIVLTQSFFNR